VRSDLTFTRVWGKDVDWGKTVDEIALRRELPIIWTGSSPSVKEKIFWKPSCADVNAGETEISSMKTREKKSEEGKGHRTTK